MDQKIIAAFDFDGTLTKRDTLIPFGLFVLGFTRWIFALILLLPSVLLFCLFLIDRKRLKEKLLTLFFGGMPYAELEERAALFVEQKIPNLLNKKGMEELHKHQQEKHLTILVSASPDIYLIPFAKKYGIDAVLGSKLATKEGVITGLLEGENCRGAEKVRRLQNYLGAEKNYFLYAYGDSAGDHELLQFADKGCFR